MTSNQLLTKEELLRLAKNATWYKNNPITMAAYGIKEEGGVKISIRLLITDFDGKFNMTKPRYSITAHYLDGTYLGHTIIRHNSEGVDEVYDQARDLWQSASHRGSNSQIVSQMEKLVRTRKLLENQI